MHTIKALAQGDVTFPPSIMDQFDKPTGNEFVKEFNSDFTNNFRTQLLGSFYLPNTLYPVLDDFFNSLVNIPDQSTVFFILTGNIIDKTQLEYHIYQGQKKTDGSICAGHSHSNGFPLDRISRPNKN
jgi:hypothetical protein